MTQQFRVPIVISERAGRDRTREPVRLGVPLPRGLLLDPAQATIADGSGRTWPSQSRALAVWPDRSVKWLLVDLLATVGANERASVFLCSTVDARQVRTSDAVYLRTEERGESILVDTGAAA